MVEGWDPGGGERDCIRVHGRLPGGNEYSVDVPADGLLRPDELFAVIDQAIATLPPLDPSEREWMWPRIRGAVLNFERGQRGMAALVVSGRIALHPDSPPLGVAAAKGRQKFANTAAAEAFTELTRTAWQREALREIFVRETLKLLLPARDISGLIEFIAKWLADPGPRNAGVRFSHSKPSPRLPGPNSIEVTVEDRFEDPSAFLDTLERELAHHREVLERWRNTKRRGWSPQELADRSVDLPQPQGTNLDYVVSPNPAQWNLVLVKLTDGRQFTIEVPEGDLLADLPPETRAALVEAGLGEFNDKSKPFLRDNVDYGLLGFAARQWVEHRLVARGIVQLRPGEPAPAPAELGAEGWELVTRGVAHMEAIRRIDQAMDALATGNSNETLRFLREDLHFKPDPSRDGDRLEAFDALRRTSVSCETVRRARDPLAYLRVTVEDRAHRLRIRREGNLQRGQRIRYGIDVEAQKDTVDPAERLVRREHSREEAKALARARHRPGLERILAVGDDLMAGRARGMRKPLNPGQQELLRYLLAGATPADAIRLAGASHRDYVNMGRKAGRAAK